MADGWVGGGRNGSDWRSPYEQSPSVLLCLVCPILPPLSCRLFTTSSVEQLSHQLQQLAWYHTMIKYNSSGSLALRQVWNEALNATLFALRILVHSALICCFFQVFRFLIFSIFPNFVLVLFYIVVLLHYLMSGYLTSIPSVQSPQWKCRSGGVQDLFTSLPAALDGKLEIWKN